MMKGRIVEWNDSKGYGFIATLSGEARIFVHISSIKNSNVRPSMADEVTFEMSKDKRGRSNAINVTITNVKSLPLTVLFGCSFLVFACVALIVFDGQLFIIPQYIFMSIFTYFMFAWDKQAAQSGNWRTSEKSLHILSLVGGWPGALFAQNHLRHKSKKQPFKAILWLTIILNVSAFCWTFTQAGAMIVQRFPSSLF